MAIEPSEGGPLDGLRILIAEDEILIALDMATTLREAGAEVIGPCATLESTLKAARDERPSVAVLDVRLGRDTTETVAEFLSGQGIPYLFYSGQTPSIDLMAKASDALVLIKPVEQTVLVAAIAALCGGGQGAALADPA